MKWCLTKEQTEQAMKAGAPVNRSVLTAYQEVLDSHPYKYENGEYIIYDNLSISDLWARIPMFIAPNGNFGTFNIDKKNGKWQAAYDGNDGKIIFSSNDRDEEIDALFDAYMFLITFGNENRFDPEEEIDNDGDYFFTGKV